MPLLGSGFVCIGASRIDRHRDGHVDHIKFVNGLHAQIFKSHDTGFLDGLAHQVGGPTHGHEVGRAVLLDGRHTLGAAFGLANHRQQACFFEQHVGEFVHAGGRGWAGRSHYLIAHRIHRAHVVDDPIGQIHRQLLAARQHIGHALVRGITPGEHLAIEQQRIARLPARHLFAGQSIKVHTVAFLGIGHPLDLGPQVQAGRIKIHRTAAVKHNMGMACGRAVRNHSHGLASGMGGIHADLHVQHRGQSAQALRANSQGIDLLVQFEPQFLDLGELFTLGCLLLQLVHVEIFHQGLLRQ